MTTLNGSNLFFEELRNKPDVSLDHVEAVEREVGTSVRYRSEQVAGAAVIRTWRPIKYRSAKPIGQDIANCLRGADSRLYRRSLLDRLAEWIFG